MRYEDVKVGVIYATTNIGVHDRAIVLDKERKFYSHTTRERETWVDTTANYNRSPAMAVAYGRRDGTEWFPGVCLPRYLSRPWEEQVELDRKAKEERIAAEQARAAEDVLFNRAIAQVNQALLDLSQRTSVGFDPPVAVRGGYARMSGERIYLTLTIEQAALFVSALREVTP